MSVTVPKRFRDLKQGDRFSFVSEPESVNTVVEDAKPASKGRYTVRFNRKYTQAKETMDGNIEVRLHPYEVHEHTKVAAISVTTQENHVSEEQMSNSKAARQWDPKSKEGQLLNQMQTQLKRADAVFTTFTAKLTDYQDPDNALSNADRVFEANGQRNIALAIIESLTRPDSISTFETIRIYVADKLSNLGTSVEHSSGMCHNLVERFNLAAWARLHESMKWL